MGGQYLRKRRLSPSQIDRQISWLRASAGRALWGQKPSRSHMSLDCGGVSTHSSPEYPAYKWRSSTGPGLFGPAPLRCSRRRSADGNSHGSMLAVSREQGETSGISPGELSPRVGNSQWWNARARLSTFAPSLYSAHGSSRSWRHRPYEKSRAVFSRSQNRVMGNGQKYGYSVSKSLRQGRQPLRHGDRGFQR